MQEELPETLARRVAKQKKNLSRYLQGGDINSRKTALKHGSFNL